MEKDTSIKTLRTIIIDDHMAIALGLKSVLDSNKRLTVKKIFTSYKRLNNYLEEEPIDIVISDLSIPNENVFLKIKEIRKKYKKLKIIIYTMHESEGMFREAMNANIDSYFLKSENMAELPLKILEIYKGYPHFPDSLLNYINGNNFLFNDNEHKIMRLINEGNSNAEIAEHLNRSLRTVEYHINNIKTKLDLKTNTELLRFCLNEYFK